MAVESIPVQERNTKNMKKKIFFPNSMEKYASYLGYFSISFEKIRFCTEILTRKVELWIFSLVSLLKKHHKTTFLVKFSV